MDKQIKNIIIGLGIVLSVLTFYFVQKGLQGVSFSAATTNLTLRVSNDCTRGKYKLLFADRVNPMMELASVAPSDTTTDFLDIVFKVPLNFQPTQIRFSLGECYSNVKIKSLVLAKGQDSVVWDAQTIYQHFSTCDSSTLYELKDGLVSVTATNKYPALESKATSDILPIVRYENNWKPIWYAVIVSILVFAIWHFLFWGGQANRNIPPQELGHIPASSKIRYYSLGIAFIVTLLLPLLVFKPLEDPNAINAEKRQRVGFPKIRVATILNYTSQLNDFLNDNFGGRRLTIEAYSLLQARIFHVSPNKSDVEIGKDDWLFYVGNEVRNYSRNRFPYTETQLKLMRKTLVENQEWLKLKGITFYLVFPPMTQSMYAENLPHNLRKMNEGSKIRQLLTYLRQTTDLNIIEVEEPLRKAKNYLQLYLKHDTHWNYAGGYIAYREMHKTISRDFNIGKPLTSQNLKFCTVDNGIGDLESMMGIPYIQKNTEVLILPPSENSKAYIDSSEKVKTFTAGKDNLYWMSYKHKQNTRLPKMLLYRDSYSGSFIQLFLDHFSQSTLIWNKSLNPEEVNYVKPDLLVFEMLERFCPLLEYGNLPAIGEELKANGIVVDDTYFSQRTAQKIKSKAAPMAVN